MKYYKVKEDDLLTMLESVAKLEALECCGVDNWEGYSSIYEELNEDGFEDFDDVASEYIKEYEEIK